MDVVYAEGSPWCGGTSGRSKWYERMGFRSAKTRTRLCRWHFIFSMQRMQRNHRHDLLPTMRIKSSLKRTTPMSSMHRPNQNGLSAWPLHGLFGRRRRIYKWMRVMCNVVKFCWGLLWVYRGCWKCWDWKWMLQLLLLDFCWVRGLCLGVCESKRDTWACKGGVRWLLYNGRSTKMHIMLVRVFRGQHLLYVLFNRRMLHLSIKFWW